MEVSPVEVGPPLLVRKYDCDASFDRMQRCAVEDVVQSWKSFVSRDIVGGSDIERKSLESLLGETFWHRKEPVPEPILNQRDSGSLIFILQHTVLGGRFLSIRFQWRGLSFCANGDRPDFQLPTDQRYLHWLSYAVQASYDPENVDSPVLRFFAFSRKSNDALSTTPTTSDPVKFMNIIEKVPISEEIGLSRRLRFFGFPQKSKEHTGGNALSTTPINPMDIKEEEIGLSRRLRIMRMVKEWDSSTNVARANTEMTTTPSFRIEYANMPTCPFAEVADSWLTFDALVMGCAHSGRSTLIGMLRNGEEYDYDNESHPPELIGTFVEQPAVFTLNEKVASTAVFILSHDKPETVTLRWNNVTFQACGTLPPSMVASRGKDGWWALAVQVRFNPYMDVIPTFRIFGIPRNPVPKPPAPVPPPVEHFVVQHQTAYEEFKRTFLPTEKDMDDLFAHCVSQLKTAQELPMDTNNILDMPSQHWLTRINGELTLPGDIELNVKYFLRQRYLEEVDKHVLQELNIRFAPHGYKVGFYSGKGQLNFPTGKMICWQAKLSFIAL